MRVYKMIVAYDGGNYEGWQSQPHGRTVQDTIEAALNRLLKKKVRVVGAGRTDQGVHALAQVAHFKTETSIPPDKLRQALTGKLPDDITILSVTEAPDDFHARHLSHGKHYDYLVRNHPRESPFWRHYAWQIWQPLDIAAMRLAAAYLRGEHDFSSFRAVGSDAPDSIREMEQVSIIAEPDHLLRFSFWAEGFVRHMVRNLVGTLVEVGRGKLPPEALQEIIAARDRARAGPTAPPQGLYLVEVFY